MLPSKNFRVFVCKIPCDLRGSFDALYKKTKNLLGMDPQSGHMFLFINKKRNRVKVLFHDGTGYIVIAKRLDKGNFCKLNPYYKNKIIFTQAEFNLYFEGAQINKRFIESPRIRN